MRWLRWGLILPDYLDRNNIAAVRLAGLQEELNLSSVQYQVRLHHLIAFKTAERILTLSRPSSPSFLLGTFSCKSPLTSSLISSENLHSTYQLVWLFGVLSPELQLDVKISAD